MVPVVAPSEARDPQNIMMVMMHEYRPKEAIFRHSNVLKTSTRNERPRHDFIGLDFDGSIYR